MRRQRARAEFKLRVQYFNPEVLQLRLRLDRVCIYVHGRDGAFVHTALEGVMAT